MLRKLLFACAGALLPIAVPAHAQGAGEVGSAVQWRDVPLLDGRTLKAERAQRRRSSRADLGVVVPVLRRAESACAEAARGAPRSRPDGARVFDRSKPSRRRSEYLAKRGYTFNVAMRSADVDRWFGRNRALPETYVVDASGKVVFVHRGEMFPEDIAALSRFAPAASKQ